MRIKKLSIKKSLVKKLQIKNLTSSRTTAIKAVCGDEGDDAPFGERSIKSSERNGERVRTKTEERGGKSSERKRTEWEENDSKGV